MKMTWMMTVDFCGLGETGSLLNGGFLLPLLLIQQRIKSMEARCVEKLALGPNVSALTFAFCSTFPLVATMEVGLGFSTDAELMGEAASVLL